MTHNDPIYRRHHEGMTLAVTLSTEGIMGVVQCVYLQKPSWKLCNDFIYRRRHGTSLRRCE
jgi:hypothetical protein